MKVLCTLPNASELIDGIKFVPHPDGLGMVSEEISDEAATRLLTISGYEAVGAMAKKPASGPDKNGNGRPDAEERAELMTRAEAVGMKPSARLSLDKLKEQVEAAEKEAADKAAADKAAAEKEAADKAAAGNSEGGQEPPAGTGDPEVF